MNGKQYEESQRRLKQLIAKGKAISDPEGGVPAERIHKWLDGVECCAKNLPADFCGECVELHRLHIYAEFDAETLDESELSASAYYSEDLAGYVDFRFDRLQEMNNLIRLVSENLEIVPHDPTLGEQLRDARLRAGQSQDEASEKIGVGNDHKCISEWEAGRRKPRPFMEKCIRAYIAKHS